MEAESPTEINVEQLGRAGIGITAEMVEKDGYCRGVKAALDYVSQHLDEDTIGYAREYLLGERYEG